KFICDGFKINSKILKSSDLDIATVREERIIDICKAVGADEYLSGNGARAYQTEEHFTQNGLKLTYLDYKPITYKQLWKDFLPCMSVLDYIFNCGFDWDYVEKSVRSINNV
ncbi:MAG: WbqC family protein, partial [Clostridia bacterium]|nr:WbqC family protein [Clostridia bacterium]